MAECNQKKQARLGGQHAQDQAQGKVQGNLLYIYTKGMPDTLDSV